MRRDVANKLAAWAWEELGPGGPPPAVCFVDAFPDNAQAYAWRWPGGESWIVLSRAALRSGSKARELLAHEIAHFLVWLHSPSDMSHGPPWRHHYRRALRILEK